MKKETLSRRAMLRTTVHLAVIGSVPVLLNGCSSKELLCDDVSGLNTADKQLRSAQNYVDKSTFGDEKNCANCQFFKTGGEDQCGTCTLIKGPINPGGNCDSWAAKQT